MTPHPLSSFNAATRHRPTPRPFPSELGEDKRNSATLNNRCLMTLCMENLPSYEATQAEQVGQERGKMSMQSELGVTTASMSVSKMKLLLQKSKSCLNARALAPPRNWRKSLSRNALLRILSPRMGCSGAVGLSSPMRGNGSLSLSALAQD